MTKKEPRLPARIQTLVGACRGGQTLCLSKRHSDVGDECVYWLEPSGRSVGVKTAEQAIAMHLLAPSGDGLFGDSQTFKAA